MDGKQSFVRSAFVAAAVLGASLSWAQSTPPASGSATATASAGGAPAAPAAADPLSGKYKGTARGSSQTDIPVTASLTLKDGKVAGEFNTPDSVITVVDGGLDGQDLALKLDASGTPGGVTGKLEGTRLTGTWELGGDSGTFELTKETAAVADLLGTWEGTAEVQGAPSTFRIVFESKDGALAGQWSGEHGSAPLENITFDGGVLAASFTYTDGATVTLKATLAEGKLSGTYDYSGGFAVGTWTAAKKP